MITRFIMQRQFGFEFRVTLYPFIDLTQWYHSGTGCPNRRDISVGFTQFLPDTRNALKLDEDRDAEMAECRTDKVRSLGEVLGEQTGSCTETGHRSLRYRAEGCLPARH